MAFNDVEVEKEDANKVRQEKPKDLQPDAQSYIWWKAQPNKLPGIIAALTLHIKNQQRALAYSRGQSFRLYSGQPATGLLGPNTQVSLVLPQTSQRITFNVIAVILDTLVSKITKNKVRPMYLTSGGHYRQQRKAKKLNTFVDGIFYENKFDQLGPEIFRDSMIDGEGVCKVFPDPFTKRIAMERMIWNELYIDEQDGLYRNPRSAHHITNVDRAALIAAFPEHETLIMTAAMPENPRGASITAQVSVAESWHLPSGPETHDGRYAITISNGVLHDIEYKRPHFPFAVLYWKTRKLGWHGQSLVEDLTGIQYEINYILWLITRSIKLMGSYKIAVENSSKVQDTHINDKIGAIIHFNKTPPQYLNPPAVNPELYQQMDRLEQKAFTVARLSMLSAAGIKPAGLNSGEAQRVYHDIEEQGFAYTSRTYEQFHLDVATLAIEAVKEIFETEGKYLVKSDVPSQTLPGRRFLKSVDWKDIDLTEDEYIQKAFPVSSLPSTPAGRIQTVTELSSAGWIDQTTAMKLLDFPDLAAVENLVTAQENWITKCLDGIVDRGRYTPPDPLMDLTMADKLARMEYAFGAASELEPKKLDMLLAFIERVAELAQPMPLPVAPPAEAPPQPLTSAPVAAPMPSLAPARA